MTHTQQQPKRCDHRGREPVQVGPYQIYASGLSYGPNYEDFDVIVPLDHHFRYAGDRKVIPAIMPDYQPPGPEFADILKNQVIPELEAGKKVVVLCIGSHGRTGTALASLVALLEPDARDPIKVVRSRHCHKAVETRQQAEYVFALRGQQLPKPWNRPHVLHDVPVRQSA